MTDERSLEEWTHGLPNSYLLCRDMGHLWRPFTARIAEGGGGYERTMRCTRCRTTRSQVLSMSGHVLSGGYTYQDGYLAPKNTGRFDTVNRDGLRLESTLRLLSKEED